MSEIKANVIIPSNLDNPIEGHEIEAAWIIANHYNDVVEFLRPIDSYRVKTADLVLNGVLFELKSPKGKSKTTIGRQLERASKQSKYIILDSRRTPIPDSTIENRIRHELSEYHSIRKVLFITKEKKVIEISSAR